MPLIPAALTTWATIQAELGSNTQGAVQGTFERYINAVSEEMAAVAGRELHYAAGRVERVKGFGTPRIYVKVTPIVSITSIEIMDATGTVVEETVAASEYGIEDAALGWIRRTGLWPWTAIPAGNASGFLRPGTEERSIRVTYVGGWVTENLSGSPTPVRNLPTRIEEACIQSVLALHGGQGSDRRIISKTEGQTTAQLRPSKGLLLPETYDVARDLWRPDLNG